MLGWSSDSREGRTRGQVSAFTACCSLWLPWPGEAWLASLQTWLFAAEARLKGAWALQASKEVLLTAWDDDCGWGREEKRRGVWSPSGPRLIGMVGLCMLFLAAAGRKGCQVRVAVLSISSASVSETILPCRNCYQACMG